MAPKRAQIAGGLADGLVVWAAGPQDQPQPHRHSAARDLALHRPLRTMGHMPDLDCGHVVVTPASDRPKHALKSMAGAPIGGLSTCAAAPFRESRWLVRTRAEPTRERRRLVHAWVADTGSIRATPPPLQPQTHPAHDVMPVAEALHRARQPQISALGERPMSQYLGEELLGPALCPAARISRAETTVVRATLQRRSRAGCCCALAATENCSSPCVANPA